MPAEEGVLGFLGKIASVFHAAPSDAHLRVWQELQPWFSRLLQNAAPKWLPGLAHGVACDVPVYLRPGTPPKPCPHSAVAACDVCHKPCCLHHARIDYLGDAICFRCILLARHVVATAPSDRPPPPRPQDDAAAKKAAEQARVVALAKARRLLRIKKDTPYKEAFYAYRRRLAAFHPDSNKDPGASKKFQEVQDAWVLVKREYPEPE